MYERMLKNGSWEVPGDNRGPSRSLPGAGRDTFGDTAKILEEFEASQAHPRAHLASQLGPAGTQKSTKNIFMSKKTASGGVTGSVFHRSYMQTPF